MADGDDLLLFTGYIDAVYFVNNRTVQGWPNPYDDYDELGHL
jgi:hypothetical protein